MAWTSYIFNHPQALQAQSWHQIRADHLIFNHPQKNVLNYRTNIVAMNTSVHDTIKVRWTVSLPCSKKMCLSFGHGGSLLPHTGFLQLWRARAAFPCLVRTSHCGGFCCCRAQALGLGLQELQLPGSRVRRAQQLWRLGLVALWRVQSSQTRHRTQILIHCTTSAVLKSFSVCFIRIVHHF